MARQATESRVARELVERYGRLPDDPNVRHGSREVARLCRCEVCRRAFPDAKKRQKVKEKARKTSSCRSGAAGHARCKGWRFDAYADGLESMRGAAPCQCACHTDGRGRPIPTLEEYVAEREADRERSEAWRREHQEVPGE